MFTLAFWKAIAERMVRGGAIAASLVLPLSAWTNIDEATGSLSLAAFAFAWGALGSLLLSLAGSQIGEKGEPSFTGAEIIAPPVEIASED